MGKLLTFFTGGWIGPLLLTLGIAAALGAGYAYLMHTAKQEGRAEIQALWDQDTAARNALAQAAAEDRREKEKQHEMEIADERRAREADSLVVGRMLSDTRRSLERLRATTATVAASDVQAASGPTPRFSPDDPPAAIGPVFDECAGQLVEVAEETEQLGVRLRGLQSWTTSALKVCGQ